MTACRRTRPWSPRRITPDYALGGHTASLGLCWMPAGTLPGFPDGMAIGQHGSWNRSTLSGYKLVFVPFENGRPSGPPRDILSGFLAPDEKVSYGRPVGVTIGPDGAAADGRRCRRRHLARHRRRQDLAHPPDREVRGRGPGFPARARYPASFHCTRV